MFNSCHLVNVLYNESAGNIIQFTFINIKYLIRHLQAIPIRWAAVQFYLSISTLDENYDISFQFNDLLRMVKIKKRKERQRGKAYVSILFNDLNY